MATITIYQTKIVENENYIVDYIDSYLNLCTKKAFPLSMTQPTALDVIVKLSEIAFDWGIERGLKYNYATIVNKNPADAEATLKTAYYFIRDAKRVAQNTVELYLHLDVINTFKKGDNFVISKRTLITREHKNRLVTSGGTTYYKIDMYPEGINPKLFRSSTANLTIKDSKIGDYISDFYLMYKNSMEDSESAQNVVDCYLVTDDALEVELSASGNIITPALLTSKGYDYYYIESTDRKDNFSHNNISFVDDISGNTITFTDFARVQMAKIQELSNGKLLVYIYSYSTNLDNDPPASFNVYLTDQITFAIGGKIYYSNSDLNQRGIFDGSDYFEMSASSQTVQTKSYANVNKTDSRIIKIIKIPYAPTSGFDYDNINHKVTFDSSIWTYNEGEQLLKLLDLNADFYQDNLTDTKQTLFPLNGSAFSTVPSLTQIRGTAEEPKMYHSEFYQVKYFYDSFTKVIPLEHVSGINGLYSGTLKIGFKMTKTINSRFMFYFSGFTLLYSDEDLYQPLVVQRNNEEVLYSSPYINYLRSGFNYDVKAKNRQEAFSWFSSALGIGAGIANIVFGSKTVGTALIASSVASIAGAINTTISAEQNLEAKIHALKWQSNSVYGADDVDLMSKYCGNKLIRTIYKPTPRMSDLLKDLFFYTGYIENRMGIPDTNTRIWFNFLACELKFESTYNIPLDCINELVDKYKGGVTFLHRNEVSSVYKWDFERQYENWEASFFN